MVVLSKCIYAVLDHGLRAVHLGGDEVWHMGKGANARKRLDSEPGLTEEEIYLQYMAEEREREREIYFSSL